MLYDAGGMEICVHVHKNNVSDGSLSSLIYRAETKNAGTPDWSRSKLQKEREEHMRRINPRAVLTIKSSLMAIELLHFQQTLDLLHGYYQNSFDLTPLQFLNQTTPSKEQRLNHFFLFFFFFFLRKRVNHLRIIKCLATELSSR